MIAPTRSTTPWPQSSKPALQLVEIPEVEKANTRSASHTVGIRSLRFFFAGCRSLKDRVQRNAAVFFAGMKSARQSRNSRTANQAFEEERDAENTQRVDREGCPRLRQQPGCLQGARYCRRNLRAPLPPVRYRDPFRPPAPQESIQSLGPTSFLRLVRSGMGGVGGKTGLDFRFFGRCPQPC